MLRNTVSRSAMIWFGILLSLGTAVLEYFIGPEMDGPLVGIIDDAGRSLGLSYETTYAVVDFIYIYGIDFVIGGMVIALVAHMVRP